MGILYLSAWLDRFGVDNAVFDTTFSNKPALYEHLRAKAPEIVAIYTNLMTKLNVLEIIRFVRNSPELENTLIVLGGPDVTHNMDDYLRAGAHLLVIGEGEQTMLDIVLARAQGVAVADPFQNIQGIAYTLADGSVHRTAPRDKMRDIDVLPHPARHKIDLQQYLDVWKQAHGHSTISISTQRGCPYTCRWCSTAVYGQSYRRRSPANVVAEILALRAQYSFDGIWFVDDVFTVSHKWLREFYAELQARNVHIHFECITRADRLDEETLHLLKDCGCFRVWIGAESGSQSVIDAMDRRVDVQQVRTMIKAARREGIQAGTFIMLGYPGETEADIRETVAHLCDSNPDLFTITVAYPIKGTGLYQDVQNDLLAALPWDSSTDRDRDFKRTYPRRYYDYAVRWTVHSVHWHKAKLAGQQWQPKAFKTLIKKEIAALGMRWTRLRTHKSTN